MSTEQTIINCKQINVTVRSNLHQMSNGGLMFSSVLIASIIGLHT